MRCTIVHILFTTAILVAMSSPARADFPTGTLAVCETPDSNARLHSDLTGLRDRRPITILRAEPVGAGSVAPKWTSLCTLVTNNNGCMPALSANGSVCVFSAPSASSESLNYDLFLSTWTGQRWSNPRALDRVSSAAWESHPALDCSGTVLLFVTNSDGKGGRNDNSTLMMSRYDVNTSTFAEPVRLGLAGDGAHYRMPGVVHTCDSLYVTVGEGSGMYVLHVPWNATQGKTGDAFRVPMHATYGEGVIGVTIGTMTRRHYITRKRGDLYETVTIR